MEANPCVGGWYNNHKKVTKGNREKEYGYQTFFNPISFVRYLPGEKFSFFPSTFFESGKRESQEEASKDIVRERREGRSKTRCRQISQVTSFPPFLMAGGMHGRPEIGQTECDAHASFAIEKATEEVCSVVIIFIRKRVFYVAS